jgi:hydrogen cyanide synthase HcnB
MTAAVKPVIVGAGPAGIRAAQALVARGLAPVVIDEGGTWGGQIYRQPPANFSRSAAEIYGFEASRAQAVHATMASISSSIDYRPRTLVWNAEHGELYLFDGERTQSLPYTHLIVATGATDRVLPFTGWTTPGVFSLGGAQVALKFQGCAIGAAVAFVGTGPLLFLVAYQYARAGVNVVAVLDAATWADKAAALAQMMHKPAVVAKGFYYVAWLRAQGVPIRTGVRPMRVLGEDRVSGLVWSNGRGERELACDAIGFGHALRSETQLADLLGCRFRFDAVARTHLPEFDAARRSSVLGVYLAGDGAGIMGADAAERAGERAALALLEDAGMSIDRARASRLERELAASARFRCGLERAFPFPENWAAKVSDDLVVCRCEQITAGELRRTVRETGVAEINLLKALSRVGMGRCQGRTCGTAAVEILAHARGCARQDVGRLRAQPPLKPIPVSP